MDRNRRILLKFTSTVSLLFGVKSTLAHDVENESTFVSKLGVSIGVDKVSTPLLPDLEGAASGAIRMSKWLRREGFHVLEFVDTDGPVFFNDIARAVHQELELHPGITELVIYFAGHGLDVNKSSQWLLSDAPVLPNEAIDFNSTKSFIQKSYLENVTFIADTCRTLTALSDLSDVAGGSIFPNITGVPIEDTDVSYDIFFATKRGGEAHEVRERADVFREGIFSNAFWRAYSQPEEKFVREIDGRSVIPNNNLEEYLKVEVKKNVSKLNINVRQVPDIAVTSEPEYYIGEVRAQQNVLSQSSDSETGVNSAKNFNDAVKYYSEDFLIGGGSANERLNLEKFKSEIKSNNSKLYEKILNTSSGYISSSELPPSAETPKLVVSGAIVKSGVYISKDLKTVEVLNIEPIDAGTNHQFIYTPWSRGTLYIEFESGCGTVVANLSDFYCQIIVEDDRVVSVKYNHLTSHPGLKPRPVADIINAVFTEIATSDDLRFIGSKEERDEIAELLAWSLNRQSLADPALMLYASYAFDFGGYYKQLNEIYFENASTLPLFDTALLTGALSQKDFDSFNVVPMCPMLSQGWYMLKHNKAELPEFLIQSKRYLKESLWTTFSVEGMQIIKREYDM